MPVPRWAPVPRVPVPAVRPRDVRGVGQDRRPVRVPPRLMSAVRVLCRRLRQIGSHISGVRGHSYEEHVLAMAEEHTCTRPNDGSPGPSSSPVGRVRPARRRRARRRQGRRPRGWAGDRRRTDSVRSEDHGTGVDGLYAIGVERPAPLTLRTAGHSGAVRSRAGGSAGRTTGPDDMRPPCVRSRPPVIPSSSKGHEPCRRRTIQRKTSRAFRRPRRCSAMSAVACSGSPTECWAA